MSCDGASVNNNREKDGSCLIWKIVLMGGISSRTEWCGQSTILFKDPSF
eukprot:CAMPEP_0184683684 /NCGR_PEP_ID=MMETSP0312-20130426/12143_1 /TAXON_ID=31354 /ORGANISM="Compsopogon coeruleus, Strain SAG 36.94" /LENGTH=48 /DNA_ID= /DNA_START= /DNA_END= /DNA_ORIENTATION=